MATKIYISANYIYTIEITGNEDKPLRVIRSYRKGHHGIWIATKEGEYYDAGLFINNIGGPEKVLAKCIEVEDVNEWIASTNERARAQHKRAHAVAMQRQEEREKQAKEEYQKTFAGEVTESNENTVGVLLRYLNTQNWGVWRLPKMTIGYACHQYDCDGKTATTIKLDKPIMVNDEMGTMFQVGAPHGHLMKYRRI